MGYHVRYTCQVHARSWFKKTLLTEETFLNLNWVACQFSYWRYTCTYWINRLHVKFELSFLRKVLKIKITVDFFSDVVDYLCIIKSENMIPSFQFFFDDIYAYHIYICTFVYMSACAIGLVSCCEVDGVSEFNKSRYVPLPLNLQRAIWFSI